MEKKCLFPVAHAWMFRHFHQNTAGRAVSSLPSLMQYISGASVFAETEAGGGDDAMKNRVQGQTWG